MKTSNLDINNKQLWYWVFFTFCFQCTDVKIGFIKISEIMLLAAAPFVFTRKMNFFVNAFFLFFSLLLVKTLLLNPSYDFYINSVLPLLKQPYFVSIARYFEILCCIVFSHLTYLFFKDRSYEDCMAFIRRLVSIQIFWIGIPFMIIYLLCRFGVISFQSVFPIVYNTQANYGFLLRLAGLYVEGGPLGLFFAFIYILFDYVNKGLTYKDLAGKAILIILIGFCAQSKAGITLLAIWYLTRFSIYFFSLKNSGSLLLLVLPLLIGIFVFVFLKISETYRGNYEMLADTRSSFYNSDAVDRSTVMGRVAGVIIVPNIVKDNPVVGIGMGNYPLMRNSPYYRASLPPIRVDFWDAHGLGGIVDILVDGGIAFLVIFIYLIVLLFIRVRFNLRKFLPLLVCFVGPFICGVQVHFLYPWFSLGLLTCFFFKQQEHERLELT